MKFHIFHKYQKPDYASICGGCYKNYGRCSHSLIVCKCGKYKAYGSHGKLTCIPDTCMEAYQSLLYGGK